jgi:tetratricopeptide (TPR) repeat protein
LPQVAPPIDAPSSNLLSRLRRNRFLKAAIALLVLIVGAWMLARQLYGWHHFDAGKRELARDHCRPALEHFQAALVIWPDDATTQFLAARASRRLGDYEAADSYLTRCQLSPAIREQAELERVLLRACRGEVEAVGGYCQTLLRQHHPDTPLILEALAQGELSLLRFAAAAHYLERWLEMAPDHPQAIYRKGQLQLEAGNLQEALALLRRAAELDPDREDVRLLLAGLYLDLGQAQEGVPHLEFVCGRQPKNHLAKARLAQGLVLLGREEEAIRLLDEVLLARPEHAPALLERGKLAFRHGDLDKAQHLLQEACKRDPGNRAAHYQLLQCLKQQGNDKEVRIVQTRLDQIHLDEARLREITTALLPQRRNDPDLYAELGELYLRMGAMKDGLHWLNRAVEIAPRHPAAHRELAKHHQSLGQHGQAQYHRELGGVTVPAPEPPKE